MLGFTDLNYQSQKNASATKQSDAKGLVAFLTFSKTLMNFSGYYLL